MVYNAKVLIVEDHPLMQAGIRRTFERCEDIEVVGEASTSENAIALADKFSPDVIIMDVKLPDCDGITTMQRIKARHRNTKVLMFSGFDDENYVVNALENGATGYILKNAGGSELIKAVRQVLAGLNPVSPQLTTKLLPYSRQKARLCSCLTPREKEVWRLLSSGASNAEISKRLFVSESTVKFHIRNIFHKLGVRNRVEAANLYKSTVA